MRSDHTGLRCALNRMRVSLQEPEQETWRCREAGHVNTGAGPGARCLELRAVRATRGWGTGMQWLLPQAPEGTHTAHTVVLASGPQTCEGKHFCSVKTPSVWLFVMGATGSEYTTWELSRVVPGVPHALRTPTTLQDDRMNRAREERNRPVGQGWLGKPGRVEQV